VRIHGLFRILFLFGGFSEGFQRPGIDFGFNRSPPAADEFGAPRGEFPRVLVDPLKVGDGADGVLTAHDAGTVFKSEGTARGMRSLAAWDSPLVSNLLRRR
jgi:hypothetical protein